MLEKHPLPPRHRLIVLFSPVAGDSVLTRFSVASGRNTVAVLVAAAVRAHVTESVVATVSPIAHWILGRRTAIMTAIAELVVVVIVRHGRSAHGIVEVWRR
jgi:hypothetical protein